MKALISNFYTYPQFNVSISHSRSLSQKPPNLFNFPTRKSPPTLKTTSFCSHSDCYGGWEDLSSVGDSSKSTQLKNLLNSLGIDEKKYVFIYLTGFVCALAVSRVKISTIVVFPACFLVFALGFSFGIVNGGDLNQLKSLFGNNKINKKKKLKDEEFRVSTEDLAKMVDLLDGFDVNVMKLKNSMRNNVDTNRISKSDLVNYVENLESIAQATLQAKNNIKGYIDNIIGHTNDVSKVSNPKRSDQKTKGKGFDFSELIAGFREKSFGSKASKVNDVVTNDSRNVVASDLSQVDILDGPRVEDENIGSLSNDNDSVKNSDGEKIVNLMEKENGGKRVFNRDEYIFKESKLRFTKSGGMNSRNSLRTWDSPDGLIDLDFSSSFRHIKSEESSGQEQKFKKSNGNRMLYDDLETSEKETYNGSPNENGFASPPSSEISKDMMFNEYVVEANSLLKQARDCLRHRGIDGDAESVLYRSAELLSKATDMKPMSLLAVGQLGNTYLLHGELKLKLSRKLRALLARNGLERVDDEVINREKAVDYLVRVCEECEELLVEAGRKYRLALSIDGNDMRALYNWGLALSFRAQLIADVGPEAAFDADKVYLAAIDKFDAMMSKSNSHTPDALFRWGVALQQRSRLRSRNSREKVKLLSQAKRLYEDALVMDSDNPQVREALSTCLSELKYKNYY